jgi:nucleotide-binding universal stress UspA family protein
MCVYKEILVPTDGSEPASTAIGHAVTLAGLCDARIHGLFVTDSGTLEKASGAFPQRQDQLEAAGEEALSEVERRATNNDIEVTTTVTGGTAYEEVVRYADENGVDLVVMGTRGRQGVERYLLGSVTERVVETAEQAVLTVDEATPTHPAE